MLRGLDQHPARVPSARLGDRTMVAVIRRLFDGRDQAEIAGRVIAVAKTAHVSKRCQQALGYRNVYSWQSHPGSVADAGPSGSGS